MEKIVTHFLKGGVMPDQIGVVTPYEGQRAHVVTTMQRVGTLRQVPRHRRSLPRTAGRQFCQCGNVPSGVKCESSA